MATTWTPERVALLQRMIEDGFSASEIAARLGGGITRNSVIGKANRLGIKRRRQPSLPAPPRTAPARRRPSPPRLRGWRAAPLAAVCDLQPLMLEDGRAASLLSLRPGLCKFPSGEGPSLAFCGREAPTGSYCPAHARIVYRPR